MPALRSESSELISETPVGKIASEGRPVRLTLSSDNNELSAEDSVSSVGMGSPVGRSEGREMPADSETPTDTSTSDGRGKLESVETLKGNEAAPDGTEKSGDSEESVGVETLNGSEISWIDEISEASEMSEASVPDASDISEDRPDGIDISAGIETPEGKEVMLPIWPGTSTRIVVMALGSNEFGFGSVCVVKTAPTLV